MVVYAKWSCIWSQQSSRLSQQLTFRFAFPKTYSPSSVVAGTWINFWVRAQQMASRHMKNGGWNTLGSNMVGHLGKRIPFPKSLVTNSVSKQDANVWSEAEEWAMEASESSVVCLIQHAPYGCILPWLPMTVLVPEWAITAVCWVGLALFIPMSSIRGQSCNPLRNSRLVVRFRLGVPVPLLPNTAASLVSNDQNHSDSGVCVSVCMCLAWKVFWKFYWKWTLSPKRLDSGNSFCADRSLGERCGFWFPSLPVFVHRLLWLQRAILRYIFQN